MLLASSTRSLTVWTTAPPNLIWQLFSYLNLSLLYNFPPSTPIYLPFEVNERHVRKAIRNH